MLKSMTGFGKASSASASNVIKVEVKSLNSKQLDLNVRMPHALREHEIGLRTMVARKAERGKIDLSVSIDRLEGAECETASHFDSAVMRRYLDQVDNCCEKLGIARPDNVFELLLRFPDTVIVDSDSVVDDSDAAALAVAAEAAVGAMMEHRRQEGIALESFFTERIEAISALLAEIEPFEAERVPRIRARLEENISRIPVLDFDKGRLEQELIFYIEKLDVNEEKQRLRRHLEYFMETMQSPVAGQGKKLGFIAQEMGREINTLGSKSNHAGMQAVVGKMKDVLEQIKEQVLNVM